MLTWRRYLNKTTLLGAACTLGGGYLWWHTNDSTGTGLDLMVWGLTLVCGRDALHKLMVLLAALADQATSKVETDGKSVEVQSGSFH